MFNNRFRAEQIAFFTTVVFVGLTHQAIAAPLTLECEGVAINKNYSMHERVTLDYASKIIISFGEVGQDGSYHPYQGFPVAAAVSETTISWILRLSDPTREVPMRINRATGILYYTVPLNIIVSLPCRTYAGLPR